LWARGWPAGTQKETCCSHATRQLPFLARRLLVLRVAHRRGRRLDGHGPDRGGARDVEHDQLDVARVYREVLQHADGDGPRPVAIHLIGYRVSPPCQGAGEGGAHPRDRAGAPCMHAWLSLSGAGAREGGGCAGARARLAEAQRQDADDGVRQRREERHRDVERAARARVDDGHDDRLGARLALRLRPNNPADGRRPGVSYAALGRAASDPAAGCPRHQAAAQRGAQAAPWRSCRR